jgi:hypothetical protein
MHSITFPIHSFVDLITNSSSEIYVSATESTLTAVEAVINSILKSQGIDKTASQLFNIKLTYSVKEYEKTGNGWKEFDTEEARTKWMEENEVDDCDEYTTQIETVVIEPKDKSDKGLQKVADALVELVYSTNAFEGQQ